MSKTMKWILGIVIGLVVIAILVTAGFMVFGRWDGHGWAQLERGAQTWERKEFKPWDEKGIQPRAQPPNREMPMQPFYNMPYHRFGGFFPLGMIFGSLFCLGILALIVLGIIALLRYITHPRNPRGPTEPADSASSRVASEVEPSQLPDRTCQNCSKVVHADWKHCPYCGAELSEPQ